MNDSGASSSATITTELPVGGNTGTSLITTTVGSTTSAHADTRGASPTLSRRAERALGIVLRTVRAEVKAEVMEGIVAGVREGAVAVCEEMVEGVRGEKKVEVFYGSIHLL